MSSSSENITTYKAFWPFYVSQHQNKVCRNFHFVGTTFVFACLIMAFTHSKWFLVGMPISGYAFAWFGHFVFERNQPATFKYPFWSLIADFQMYAFMCMGRMDREVKRMGVLHSEPGA
jgi:hypothetical protein